MRIISNFQDYYDACQYMCGEDVVYERIMNNRKKVISKNLLGQNEFKIIEDPRLKDLEKLYFSYFGRNPFGRNQTSLFFIGEKIVQFLHYKIEIKNDKNGEISYIDNFLYNEEDIFDYYDKEIKFLNKNAYIKDKNKLNDFQHKVREIVPEVPLIYFGTYESGLYENNHTKITHITLNPMLKKFKFKNKMDSFEVIQEIELFLKKYNSIEKEVDFSDKEKIIQAGFDLKTSFRK